MGAPSSLTTLSTFLNYKVRYTPFTSTVKYQCLEYTIPISMAHAFSSLTSSFRWKTTMKTSSDTGLSTPHTKELLTT